MSTLRRAASRLGQARRPDHLTRWKASRLAALVIIAPRRRQDQCDEAFLGGVLLWRAAGARQRSICSPCPMCELWSSRSGFVAVAGLFWEVIQVTPVMRKAPQGSVMSSWLSTLIIVAGAGFGLWLVSHIIEALRPRPDPPAALRWAPKIPNRLCRRRGIKLRFIRDRSRPDNRSAAHAANTARSV